MRFPGKGKSWMSIESDGEGTLRISKDPPMERKVNEPVFHTGVFWGLQNSHF